jgi:hypothetical protein
MKSEGKRPYGRPRFRWDVRGMDWIDLAQARDRWQALVRMVMNLCVQ